MLANFLFDSSALRVGQKIMAGRTLVSYELGKYRKPRLPSPTHLLQVLDPTVEEIAIAKKIKATFTRNSRLLAILLFNRINHWRSLRRGNISSKETPTFALERCSWFWNFSRRLGDGRRSWRHFIAPFRVSVHSYEDWPYPSLTAHSQTSSS